MTAREDVLARIRTAIGPAGPATEIVRDYRKHGARPQAELVELLAERLRDYKATVRICAEDTLEATLAGALAGGGRHKVVVPTGLADLAAPDGVVLTVDDGDLSWAQLDSADAVVTGSTVAIAETGTIVLDASPDQGRRAISLVPDYHLCIVRAASIVETVPEAIATLDPTRPLTWISGPSATSDIELNRVEGVHGPRTLDVILVT
jgi:L-lactate dehydrogenase complex protein LldG